MAKGEAAERPFDPSCSLTAAGPANAADNTEGTTKDAKSAKVLLHSKNFGLAWRAKDLTTEITERVPRSISSPSIPGSPVVRAMGKVFGSLPHNTPTLLRSGDPSHGRRACESRKYFRQML